MENKKRTLYMEEILSITSGKIFTTADRLTETLSYLAQTNIPSTSSSTFFRAYYTARGYILSQYPELRNIGDSVTFNSHEQMEDWLEQQKQQIGNGFVLTPMPAEIYPQVSYSVETVAVDSLKSALEDTRDDKDDKRREALYTSLNNQFHSINQDQKVNQL